LDELFDWTKGKRFAVEERIVIEKDCGRQGIAVDTGEK